MTVCSTVNNCGSTIGGRRLADEASAPVRTGATRFVAGCAIRCGGKFEATGVVCTAFRCDSEHQPIGSGPGRLDERQFQALRRRNERIAAIRWRTLEELCYI